MNVIATENERVLIPEHMRALKTIVTGVGALNVINALMDIPRDTPLDNFGYAGSRWFAIGKSVEIGKVETHHPNVEYEEPKYKLMGDVKCITSLDFVLEDTSKEPCVYDMELAFILAMGFTDVSATKTVSDNLNYDQYELSVRRVIYDI